MASKEAAISAGEQAGYSREEALRLMKELSLGNSEAITYFSGVQQHEVAQIMAPVVLRVIEIFRKKTPDPEANEPQPQNPSMILGVRSRLGPTHGHGKGGSRARSQRSRSVESLVIRREEKNNQK